jgi:3-hydroxyacyl-CoA dehydrogenase
MQINDVTVLDREGDVAVITIDSPPVNALSAAVRSGIVEAMQHALSSDGVRGQCQKDCTG